MKQFLLAAAILLNITIYAQHDHSQHAPKKDTAKRSMPMPAKKDTVPSQGKQQPAQGHEHRQMNAHEQDQMDAEGHEHHQMNMSHAFSKNLPMNRNGSGTGWLPDNSPMYGYMFHTPKWMYMLHGNLFLRYNRQDLLNKGSRGNEKFDAPNWAMLMGQREAGKKGLFRFSAMLSLDPLTVGASGYPLLFQTGESYKGQPLIDRQHPHDLFSELSVAYTHSLSEKADAFVYVGYPGEPALGPVAFMHRPSALNNPDAPLTHHWVDATHITFGVATLGLRYGKWKVEGSSFTGREPDEDRYDFDKPRFDSWSGRLSCNPSAKWALQLSHGFIKEPELLHPGEDVHRTTASASFSTRGFGYSFMNLTALWGMNKVKDHEAGHGALLEASWVQKKLDLYGRYEWVQKSVGELGLDENEYGHDAVFPTHAFTAGASYNILNIGQTKLALGTQFSIYNADKRISGLYGQNPMAGQVYLRIYPGAMGSRQGRLFLPN
jgi:hypothetical protein